MPTFASLCKSSLRLAGLVALLTVPSFAAGLSASATYTEVPDSGAQGVYDYSLTLDNTGTTTIGTFWFGWTPGGNFLSPKPTNVTLPAGWTDTIVSNALGSSIRWESTTNLLQPGQTLSGFDFQSTETPLELLGTVPAGTGAGDAIVNSFVYIGAPFADPGFQFVPTAATPEPDSFLLLATGMLAGVSGLYLRFRGARPTWRSETVVLGR
jgi:hypothetical protein